MNWNKRLLLVLFSLTLIITNMAFIGGQLEIEPVLRNVTLQPNEEVINTDIQIALITESEVVGYKSRWGVTCYKNY